jgi:hypothetical protein
MCLQCFERVLCFPPKYGEHGRPDTFPVSSRNPRASVSSVTLQKAWHHGGVQGPVRAVDENSSASRAVHSGSLIQ